MRPHRTAGSSLRGVLGTLADTHFKDRAHLHRILDLGQAVKAAAALVHEVQKERGLSSGYLASGGLRFVRDLPVQRNRTDQAQVRADEAWDALDDRFRTGGLGAALASARERLAGLGSLRADVTAQTIPPASAIQGFSDLADRLLAFIAEAPGTSPHPQVTLALLSLFHFVTAKEFTGQERALGSAVCGQGHFEPFQWDRFQSLQTLREEALEAFARHASAAQVRGWEDLARRVPFGVLAGLRRRLEALEAGGESPGVEEWYQASTAVIDTLRTFETGLLENLDQLCLSILAEARSAWEDSQEAPEDRERLVARRLEKTQARLLTERQGLRLGQDPVHRPEAAAVQAEALATGTAATVEEALRWRRDLGRAGATSELFAGLIKRARVLALDAEIHAFSRAQVAAEARALVQALEKAAAETGEQLGILSQSSERTITALEGLHTAALSLHLVLLEDEAPPSPGPGPERRMS